MLRADRRRLLRRGVQTVGQYRTALLQHANALDVPQAAAPSAPGAPRAQADLDAKDAVRYRQLPDKSEPGICAFYLSGGLR